MAITRDRVISKIVSTKRRDLTLDVEVYYRNIATDDVDGEVFISDPDLITPERYATLSPALQTEARDKLIADMNSILALFPAPT